MTILKEFALELEYIPNEQQIHKLMQTNNWEYYTSTEYDYNKNWKEKNSLLGFQTRCVTSLYEKHFIKFKTDDFWKIQINCVSKITNSQILVIGGVCEVQVVFDIDNFFELSNYEKKETTLQTLKQGIDLVIKEKQWDKLIFDNAYNKVIDYKYENNWIWKNTKINPSKKLVAKVYVEHDIKSVDISIMILTRKGDKLKIEKVITERPDELCFSNHLGELKWVTDNEVVLVNKFNTKQWNVKL